MQVTMVKKEAAELACKDPNPIIDGRKANVNLAYLGAKPRGSNAMLETAETLCMFACRFSILLFIKISFSLVKLLKYNY